MEKIIVSQHSGAVEWLRKFADISENTVVLASVNEDDVRGKIVYGNVPLSLAAAAICVYAIEFTGQAPRGREYTIGDMIDAGARLQRYAVYKLQA